MDEERKPVLGTHGEEEYSLRGASFWKVGGRVEMEICELEGDGVGDGFGEDGRIDIQWVRGDMVEKPA